MTRGYPTVPARPAFERAVLTAIGYADYSRDWEKLASTGAGNDAIIALLEARGRFSPFNVDRRECRFEIVRGKPCLWYGGKCLGGLWLLDRIREIVGID